MDKVLRASKAGFPCMRNLWYSVNGFPETVSPKSQRIFDVGTALEPVIVEWLKADGWNVEYNPGSQNAELEVTVPIEGGKLAGHPDCIISKGEIQNALVDIKTMNDRAFTHWKREGSLKTKPQYVTQLHIYAMGLKEQGRKIEHLGIVGVNKNNSDMYIDLFDFDESTSLDILIRAECIVNAEGVPEFECPTEKWACSYCEFARQCELDREPFLQPEAHEAKSEVPITDDETTINAMKALQNARELLKHAKELEAGAKIVLDENVKDKGLCTVQGGGLLFSVKERISQQLDTSAIKKEHPEIAIQYTKPVSSTVYNIKPLKEKTNEDL